MVFKKIAISLAVIFLAAVTTAQAQTPLALAPWEFSLEYLRLSGIDSDQFLLGARRVVPLLSLLPQVTSDSKIEVMQIAVGARNHPERDSDFRIHVTGMDLLLQRAQWGAGVTLLDYDGASASDLNSKWINIATGPGFHKSAENGSVSFKAMGTAGLSSWKFGRQLFATERDASDIHTGLSYGFILMAAAHISDRLFVSSQYEQSFLSQGLDLQVENFLVEIRAQLTRTFAISIDGGHDSYELGNKSRSFDRFGFSVRYRATEALY